MTPPTASVVPPPATEAPTSRNRTDLRRDGSHEGAANGRIPRARRKGGLLKLLAVLGVVVLTASGALGAYLYFFGVAAERPDLILHSVKREKLQLTIVERGQLEAAQNEDIHCRVKARSQGSTTATTIKWVIDDGSHVKKGDLLIVFDDSGLQEQLKAKEIDVNTAHAAKIKAEEDFKIALSENDSQIGLAKTALEIATLDLQKYKGGDLQMKRKDIEGRILVARADLDLWKDKVGFSERLVRGKYISEAQLEADRARERSARVSLERLDEELRVFNTFESIREMKRLESDEADKRSALSREQGKAKSKEVQAESEKQSKRKLHEQEVARMEEIKEQIELCKIHAPQDGLVVYFIPESSRGGFGSRQSIVQQGEPVSEGQRLMRIPNLSHMLVNTKVHEALVSRVRAGQPARVRVDAFPEKEFNAKIKSVATVAAQNDWMSTDVKVYQTMVSIEDEIHELGLKPGMSSAVTIFTESRVDEALTIPLQAVLGSSDMGRKRKCFVMGARGPEEREITVGISNEKMVEVKEGLSESDQVVLNPRSLLSDKDRKSIGGGDRMIGGAKGGPDPGAMSPGGWPGKGGDGANGGGGEIKGGMPPPGKADGKGGWPGKGVGAGGKPGGFSKAGEGKKGPPTGGDGGKAAGAGQ